MQLNQDNNI